jgi:hypothetical protein
LRLLRPVAGVSDGLGVPSVGSRSGSGPVVEPVRDGFALSLGFGSAAGSDLAGLALS